jgi:formate hydrogenlyase subunit 3/multisubunit Na+/H+ antiporter MnhD subunit
MTEIVSDPRPFAAVMVSAVAIVFILASHRYPNVRESWSVLAALTKFGIVASMVPGVLDGKEYEFVLTVFVPGDGFYSDIEFALQADALGMIFALLASFLWIFTAFYAAGYMRGLAEHGQTRFFASFAASLSAAIGIAFAANLLTIFIFYELLSVATYPLVAHDEDEEARIAGRKYLAYTFFGGGVLLLAGTALVFMMAGTTDFGMTAAEIAESNATLARAAFALLAAGFGVKAALMPMHSWLPDAMVAPTPVSGLLHAVAVVKSGVFGISRLVLEVYDPGLVGDLGVGLPLAIVAAFTLTVASIIALRADRLKKRLAYSTISQLSYIVLGLGLVGPAAVTGAGLENVIRGGLLHIPAHAFMKLTLFFCAGIIHVETHTDYISEMDGIGKRMPLTMTAFAIAAAGMAGIPLVAGFVSKWFILIGAVEASQSIFAVVLLVSGVLNILYFWPIVYGAFFESHDSADEKPLVEGPLGGRFSGLTATDGGSEPVPDGGETADDDEGDGEPHDHEGEHTHHDHEHAGHDDGHHGGPGPDGWERVGWMGEESTWLMLGPILLVAAGAIVLGVIPDTAIFLKLIEVVVQGVMA